jgi:hypothetical protein
MPQNLTLKHQYYCFSKVQALWVMTPYLCEIVPDGAVSYRTTLSASAVLLSAPHMFHDWVSE